MPLVFIVCVNLDNCSNPAWITTDCISNMKNDSELEEPRYGEMKWRQNIKTRCDEIIACLSPMELLQYFDYHELVSSYDKEILLLDTKTRQEKVKHILQILEITDKKDAYTTFVKCLDEEVHQRNGFHIGHEYLLTILKGEKYASEAELRAFKASKTSVLKHRSGLYDINLSSLVPVMYARNLITSDEMEVLLDSHAGKTSRAKIEKLLQMLDTKGPSAYAKFEACLNEENTHPTHSELYKMIGTSRKRKNDYENIDEVCSIPKRTPQRLHMEKPLCGKVYSGFVADIDKCYQKSSWVELETLAQMFFQQNEDPQLRALAMIEKGYSFSCRKGMSKMAFASLDEAQVLARQINGSNYYFLLARCKHIRAAMLRYEGKDDESLTTNQDAYHLLSDCAPGDDASRVMYGIACARLENLGKMQCNPPLQEINDIRAYFDFCTNYSHSGTPGLCASKARCLIRSAQVCIGTTTDGKYWAVATPDDLEKAEHYLKQVDLSAISRRCQALYYIIESDLFKSMDNTTKAIDSTKRALRIAKENQLGAELNYAESRLQRLKH